MASEQLVRWAQIIGSILKPLTHRPLNHHLLNLELSPHESFRLKMTDLWGEGAIEKGKNLG